ncbi:hypothetical protein WJ05_27915 [Burkholderia vietnamiensis]|uniref:PD-(D/E)XK nuclease domain-containing protein n=1 Tax=Burkholderia vietnamiensis TaxID=60552 RepID=UPI000759821C|nr:hypothetical protein [Burkholderia vietnamiensis]KVF05625.1 hypothetical protein WJ05_27915 [Burkholderia vietnamiensis]
MKELTHWELRKSLGIAAVDDPLQPPHARAFVDWIQHESLGQAQVLATLSASAAVLTGPERQTAHAAVLGYATNLDNSHMESFSEALDWLQQRQYFVAGRPQTFEIDGLALLGVALGILKLDAQRAPCARTWLQGLLERSLVIQGLADWNQSLTVAALNVLGISSSTPLLAISDDLKAALAAKALVPITQESRANAWAVISSLAGAGDGMTRAAAQLTALAWLLRDASTLRLGSTSVADVARLLAGVNSSMRRWSWDLIPRTPKSREARWDIENEYHVQDLLWAILSPVFPDLDDEEWLKSLGQHHPRADLAIPSLALIIEVKFLRKGKSVFSTVIQEVAADASTYLQEGSGYQHLLAFVWDDEARTEEHTELRKGLMQIRGVDDAIVLSRPSKMKRQPRDGATDA